MAIPMTAKVKVQVLKISGLPAVTLSPGDTRYARAYFFSSGVQVVTGRSRPIPDAGGDFDLTAEPSAWSFEASVDPGWILGVGVETCEDRGDLAPPKPTTLTFSSPYLGLGYGTIEDPWTSGVRKFGQVEVLVTTTLVKPVDKAFLARAMGKSKASGALVIPQGFIVEIVDILGLYKPDPAAKPPMVGSKHVAGYLSDDNKGRIFTNRLPDGTWAKDEQFIEVQVKITAFGGLTIPAGAKIDWTIEDVDDPTNEGRDFHREWGRYVDANDYDAAGEPIGAHPGDNSAAFKAGNADESKLFGAAARASAAARWSQATGGPAPVASSRMRAKTGITLVNPKNGKSSVRIHCMNVLGTNLRVRTELTGTPAGKPVVNASSGVMTMWSRIDVEVVRMAGAHSMSGALPKIPKFFLPACVQLDFQTERTVTGALDKPEMASSEEDSVFDPATIAWVNNAGVFTHAGDPGWFFLGAGRFPYPLPPAGPIAPILTVTSPHYTLASTARAATLEVTGAAASAVYVDFTWKDAAGVDQNAGFGVNRTTAPAVSGGKTKMKLWGNDVIPDFTGDDADGSLNHAYRSTILYFPRHQRHDDSASPLVPGGFGVPTSGAKVEVWPPGATFTSGVSPTVKNPAKPMDDFFAGRTIQFTHVEKFSEGSPPKPKPNFDEIILQVVVHELIHAFGMPHKCGNWNWRTPRQPDGKSCCMNYFDTWLLDASKNVIPNTVGKQSDDMCGRHLMEVRRVHLEKNLGLKW